MFTLMSWNVEHFRGAAAHLDRVANLIRTLDPDVYALFEVEGLDVLQFMRNELPGYD